MKRKYTIEEFKIAIEQSTSIRQVLDKLGLKPAGGNYRSCNKLIQKLQLDTSHFSGQSHSKGKTLGPKKPITEYLNNKQTIQSYKLKRRLIKEGYFEKKCYQCELEIWNNQPIPLELEHIDGNHLNNNLSNLTLLCPNCHAQTSTYRGKNKS